MSFTIKRIFSVPFTAFSACEGLRDGLSVSPQPAFWASDSTLPFDDASAFRNTKELVLQLVLMNDFKADPPELRAAMYGAVQRVLESGWYVLGHEVRGFEQAWADVRGVARHWCG